MAIADRITRLGAMLRRWSDDADTVATSPATAERRTLLVRAGDLLSRRFGARIGVIRGSADEQALRLLIGDADDAAQIVPLDSYRDVSDAFDDRRIDSFYASLTLLGRLAKISQGALAVLKHRRCDRWRTPFAAGRAAH